MPIQGVSDRESAQERFRTIGKLRKGGEKRRNKKGQWIFGEDLPYFRFTSEDPAVEAAFRAAYGDEPKEMVIYLPYATMEENFTAWRELYGQNGLVQVRCDGANWVDWIAGPYHRHGSRPCTKEFKDTPNRCPGCPLMPVGRLQLILPKLWEADQVGLITLETHSWNDIAELAGKLLTYEPLQGKPFTLWREETKIGAPNEREGKRMAVHKHLVFIELTAEFLRDRFIQAKRHALVEVKALPESTFEEAEFEEEAPDTPEPEPAPREPPSPAPTPEPAPEEPPAEGKAKTNGKGSAPRARAKGNGGRAFPVAMLDAVIEHGYAEDRPSAARMLGRSQRIGPDDAADLVLAWCGLFRSATDVGDTAGDAAEFADAKIHLPGDPDAESARPYTPEQVKDHVAGWTIDDEGAPASDAQKVLVRMKLEECFADQDERDRKRHTVQEWLLGFDSTDDLTKRQASALLSWLLDESDSQDGEHPLHAAASLEAAAIVKVALVEAGQESLPL